MEMPVRKAVNNSKQSALQSLKNWVPGPVKDIVRFYRGERVFKYDKYRFTRNYGESGAAGNTQSRLEGRITFHAHALEKGMSHNLIRYQFGSGALRNLSAAMDSYIRSGFDSNSLPFLNGLTVLREYIRLHEQAGESLAHLNDIFSPELIDAARECEFDLGGVHEVHRSSKADNQTKNFKELFLGRWSVREYAADPVDLKGVLEAIEISLKAPSICNRQSARVVVMDDEKLIAKVLEIQGGFRGYHSPPVLLMVTTDTSSFLSKNERNQVYTDGGLYAMSLLLSLEYVGLAACPLNTMFSVKQEKAMRRALAIPENENLIMFISVGNFQNATYVPKSFRLTSDQITRHVSP